MKKSQSTLKIHNITFSQPFNNTVNQETLRSRVKLTKNSNQYFFSKGNKQNSVQKKYDKHPQSFNIKTLHPNKSCLFTLRPNEFNEVFNRYQSHSRLIHLNDAKPYFFIRKSSHEIPHGTQHQNHTQAEKRLISQSSGRRYLKKITQKPLQPAIIEKKKLIINTNDKIFTTKVSNYFQFLKQAAKLHQIQIQFSDYKKLPTVIVGGGNNSKLVKDILKKRWWLKIKDKKSEQPLDLNQVNFIWTQIKVREFFQGKVTKEKSIHNHFEFNGQLGNKKQLFMNLKRYYESQNKDPFSIIPLTFHLKNTNDKDFQQFQQRFEIEKQRHTNKSQLWIMKPGQNSNRGQGITIHCQLEEIKKLIDKQTSQSNKQNEPKQTTFIVQKYIEKPFLYQKRKFDIRCYYLLVSLNNKIKAYWYKQGYIRTSCFEYDCNSQNNQNIFVHLTNDAVQKNNENYGKFEEGNKIDFTTFKKYLNTKYPHQKYDFDTQIWSAIKLIALDSIKATYQKLKRSEKPMFQIFGLDFMIDQDFKPWLIEVNTNPCLQTTCLVLEKIIPKMVDDSFQLSLDLIFPPPETWSSSKKYLVPTNLKSGFELIFDEDQQNKMSQTIENSCSL